MIASVNLPALEADGPLPEGTTGDVQGYGHMGPAGAGHFVKMVHNGIEYGMMQAFAEGFELMHSKTEFDLNMEQVATVWRYGSVIRSWLLDLSAEAFRLEGNDLEAIRGFVPDSGEGRWTVLESIEQRVPLPVITLALQMRFRSRQADSYAAKINAALRKQFGGHAVQRDESVPTVRRCYIADPFGNRIELLQAGDSFSGPTA